MIDWDAELLGPVMDVFGEGSADAPSSWPVYTPLGGTAFPLRGAVFDRAYSELTLDGEGSEVTAKKPCLGVRASLFAAPPAQDDAVYIPSVGLRYLVKDVQADGHGHIKLMLLVARDQ